MEILICPSCRISVAVGSDLICPSCRMLLTGVTSQDTPVVDSSGASDVNTKQNLVPHKAEHPKAAGNSAETHFDIFSVCFSFNGRIPRSVYWLTEIASVVLLYFGLKMSASMLPSESLIAAIVSLLLLLLFFWSQIAICVKRFHDLGMSGFWLVILLIPGIGQIVQFFLLALRCGEKGGNKYGPDPLELFK